MDSRYTKKRHFNLLLIIPSATKNLWSNFFCTIPKCQKNYVMILRNLHLTLAWRKSPSYRNQPIDLLCKSMTCFLYDRDLRHEWDNIFEVLQNRLGRERDKRVVFQKSQIQKCLYFSFYYYSAQKMKKSLIENCILYVVLIET